MLLNELQGAFGKLPEGVAATRAVTELTDGQLSVVAGGAIAYPVPGRGGIAYPVPGGGRSGTALPGGSSRRPR